MQIIIHACPQRMWYVRGILVPELTAQGIASGDIDVKCDTERRGNLNSCMRIFAACKGKPGGAWHLQDDVFPSADFAQRIAEHDDGVVCGYVNEEFGPDVRSVGFVTPDSAWNSFPCIRLPHELAAACAEWFYNDARHRPEFAPWVQTGKRDDSFFHVFLEEQMFRKHTFAKTVLNLSPCLVEHVDWLVGGSIVNRWRGHKSRAYYWDDEARIDELAEWIKRVRNA